MDEQWKELDREILEKRASQLSAPLVDDNAAEDTVTLLTFTLMGGPYAVTLSAVEAVIRVGDIFSVPLTPRHIQGVIRRRGQTIALISLRHFFHPDAESLIDADFAVISLVEGKQFALQVEEIHGVTILERSKIMPPPDNYDKTQAPYLAGVTTDGLAVLDLEQLVSAEGFRVDK